MKNRKSIQTNLHTFQLKWSPLIYLFIETPFYPNFTDWKVNSSANLQFKNLFK